MARVRPPLFSFLIDVLIHSVSAVFAGGCSNDRNHQGIRSPEQNC